MHRTLEDFIQAVRGAEVRVSVAETLEAFETVRIVGYSDRQILKDALSVTVAKTREEKLRFEQAFERFFTSDIFGDAAPGGAAPAEDAMPEDLEPNLGLTAENEARIVEMLLRNDKTGLHTAMREAAREVGLANITLFTQKGIYLQRIMRRMGLDALDRRLNELEATGEGGSEMAERLRQARGYFLDQVRDFVQQQMQLYTGASHKQLREESLKDRRLSKLEVEDFDRMKVIVQEMARRLANVHARRAKRAQRGQIDIRRTLRNNMGYDGELFDLHWKRTRIDRPRVVAICDVSRSVAAYSRFLLLFLYSMAEVMARIRTFTFCSDVAEVTDIMENNPVEEALLAAQVAAPIGSTDYGQTFRTLEQRYLDAFTPKTTVLILGDARNNQLPAEASILKTLQQHSRNIIWLNPESPISWATGDSEMGVYRPFCQLVKECGTINQLQTAIDQMLKLSMRAA